MLIVIVALSVPDAKFSDSVVVHLIMNCPHEVTFNVDPPEMVPIPVLPVTIE